MAWPSVLESANQRVLLYSLSRDGTNRPIGLILVAISFITSLLQSATPNLKTEYLGLKYEEQKSKQYHFTVTSKVAVFIWSFIIIIIIKQLISEMVHSSAINFIPIYSEMTTL